MRLEAKSISFRYTKRDPWILKNQSFSVASGERVALFAPSGIGKSTLAMIMAGYYRPVSGEVLLDGRHLPKKGVCPVQLIHQHPEKAINPRWRLKKVLEESGQQRRETLASFGIEAEWLNRFPRELSGGELQRFCLARALMADASFLICDEISAMLDVISQAQIWERLLEEAKRRELGMVVVTHSLALANRVCDRVYDLSKQKYLD